MKLRTYDLKIPSPEEVALRQTQDVIAKADVLLNNPRSPIFSFITTTKDDVDEDDEYEDTFLTPEDYMDEKFDVDHYQRLVEQARRLTSEVTLIGETLMKLNSQLNVQIVQKDNQSKERLGFSTNQDKVAQDIVLREQVEERARQIYKEYL